MNTSNSITITGRWHIAIVDKLYRDNSKNNMPLEQREDHYRRPTSSEISRIEDRWKSRMLSACKPKRKSIRKLFKKAQEEIIYFPIDIDYHYRGLPDGTPITDTYNDSNYDGTSYTTTEISQAIWFDIKLVADTITTSAIQSVRINHTAKTIEFTTQNNIYAVAIDNFIDVIVIRE